MSKEHQETYDTIHELTNLLYGLPDCGAGGPLHVLTDDGNVDDRDLEYVLVALSQVESPSIRHVGHSIVHLYATLSPAQRAAVWTHRPLSDDLVGRDFDWVGDTNDFTVTGYWGKPPDWLMVLDKKLPV